MTNPKQNPYIIPGYEHSPAPRTVLKVPTNPFLPNSSSAQSFTVGRPVPRAEHDPAINYNDPWRSHRLPQHTQLRHELSVSDQPLPSQSDHKTMDNELDHQLIKLLTQTTFTDQVTRHPVEPTRRIIGFDTTKPSLSPDVKANNEITNSSSGVTHHSNQLFKPIKPECIAPSPRTVMGNLSPSPQ